MDKGVITALVAACVGTGSCLGGYEGWSQSDHYQRTLRDPDFYHLVDDVGNPVSQNFQEPNN